MCCDDATTNGGVAKPKEPTVQAMIIRPAHATTTSTGAPKGGAAWSPDFLRIALFALLVITVSRIHQNFPVLERLRPGFVLFWLAVLGAVLNPKFRTVQAVLVTWPAKVVIGLAVLACLSAPFGMSLGGSATFIIDEYSKTLILAFLLML